MNQALGLSLALLLPSALVQPQESPRRFTSVDLVELAGSWSGELEYVDYSDDGSKGRVDATFLAHPCANDMALETEIRMTEPGVDQRTTSIIAIDRDDVLSISDIGRMGVDHEAWTISSFEPKAPSEWTLVIERDGADNNVPARLRRTLTLDSARFSIRQDYRSLGDAKAPWKLRNRLNFQRTEPSASDLVGTWTVDLRPTPDAPPYTTEFVVTSVEDGDLEGTFYGTAIRDGRVNTSWGEVHFSFVTEDGSGPYNTQGRLTGNMLKGTTHSLGRSFLSVWTAPGDE